MINYKIRLSPPHNFDINQKNKKTMSDEADVDKIFFILPGET